MRDADEVAALLCIQSLACSVHLDTCSYSSDNDVFKCCVTVRVG